MKCFTQEGMFKMVILGKGKLDVDADADKKWLLH